MVGKIDAEGPGSVMYVDVHLDKLHPAFHTQNRS